MYIQWNPKQQNERMGKIISVLIWKELQDVLTKKKKGEKDRKITVCRPFYHLRKMVGGEAGMSVFACICIRVSGRIYKKLITMVTYFPVARRT